jgi:short-subunit dehydrogenase
MVLSTPGGSWNALVLLLQAAEAELVKNKGVVINVSSGVAVAAAPVPAMSPYFIAKASQVRHAHV